MDFDNSFEVPLPPDQAWRTLMDIERIAPCMPGAELTEIVDDKRFNGKVSVQSKIGKGSTFFIKFPHKKVK